MKTRYRTSVLMWLFYFIRMGVLHVVYDVAIIGAGVTGALTARELSRYDLRVCLLERDSDVAMGSTKANSAIVHAGYDAVPGSLKAILNVQGNRMFESIAAELDIPFKRIGSLVLAFTGEEMETLWKLYRRGMENGVPGLRVLTSLEEVKALEPNVSQTVIGALHAPSAGITCPYELTFGAVENAVSNGAELMLETQVTGIVCAADKFILSTNRGPVQSRFVVNAAGLYADAIARMIGEEHFHIRPRKGEYLLLDKSQGQQVHSVIFQAPSALGKGILVTPTVDGNLLIGPNAVDVEDKEDFSTTVSGLAQVTQGALKSVPGINTREAITSFAGLRAVPSTGDFILAPAANARRFIHAAGIESPGLTAAPAIALYVVELLKDEGLALVPKKSFKPCRKAITRFSEADEERKRSLIDSNRLYGQVICRCELVTEGEIVDCIRRPAGARTVDAVKRRTRSGMGRCQGGFCSPRIAEILSRELGMSVQEVTKKGGGSALLTGKTKEAM